MSTRILVTDAVARCLVISVGRALRDARLGAEVSNGRGAGETPSVSGR